MDDRILVVDIGGSNVKVRMAGGEKRKAPTGPDVGPGAVVEAIADLAKDLEFDCLTIGFPGPVVDGRPADEPNNLGAGWVDFDFAGALGRPVRLLNDALLQAIGGYEGGRMLFLGLGTGLGSALIVDDAAVALELAHLPYRKGRTFEDDVGADGRERLGRKKWERAVHEVTDLLRAALVADDVLLGGGNADDLRELPDGARLGGNADAFDGGLRVWREERFVRQFRVLPPGQP